MTKIEKQIKQINDEMQKLRSKRMNLVRTYVKPFEEKAIQNIELFNLVDATFKFDIIKHYFDNEDECYVIHVSIQDKNFKNRLEKKHTIIRVAHKGIEDEFALKHIRIIGAIVSELL